MVDLTQGLRQASPIGPPPPGGREIAVGYVSALQPLPATFDDPVWVIVPAHSSERLYGPLAWPAIHGATLPTARTAMWVAFDADGTPLVVSWTGTHS
jgi:hypothetical protein